MNAPEEPWAPRLPNDPPFAPERDHDPERWLAHQLAQLRLRLDPAQDGTCRPYVVTPDGRIHTSNEPSWDTAIRAHLMSRYPTNTPYIWQVTDEPGPLLRRQVVPVHRTIDAAIGDLCKQAASARSRIRRIRRWHAHVDAALAAGPAAWPSWSFPANRQAAVWIMRRILAVYQDGRCGICATPRDDLCLDHDHQSGEVRGDLCPRCNGREGNPDYREEPQFVAYRANPPAGWLGWRHPEEHPHGPPKKASV